MTPPHYFALLTALLTGLSPLLAANYGLETRPAVGPFLNGVLPTSGPTVSGNWTTTPAFPNLTFTNALGLTFVPGTTKLIVWEREGRAWVFENDPATTLKTKVLDISNQCQGWDDSGLLGLAFHPGFTTNRYVFVYYTWVTPGTVVGSPTVRPPTFKNLAYHDRLSRLTLDDNLVAIPNSELVLVDQAASSVWHNGGGMFFHPDNGFLYWTDGDDETGPTQIVDQDLLSGVFRIDVDQRGGAVSHPIVKQPANGKTANYYVPNDNPFVGQAGALEEFYGLGLRSPHRMTYDPPSKRIFIGDVGNASWEEIDVIEPSDPPGLNFQWSVIEGLHGDLVPPYPGVNKRPVLNYGHDEGQAVIGGYVYRGSAFATDLGGKYIFGDNVQGKIWAMDETTVPYGKKLLCVLPKGPGVNSGSDYTGLSSFGIDANNELYLCQMGNLGGHVYKLARSGPPPTRKDFPPLLSQTGAFLDPASMTPSEGLIPYTVNTPLWSDGAFKSRWMALPTNGVIGFAPTGEWTFPSGSVFVKHFELAVDDTDPAAAHRRLETRFLVRDTNGTVFGANYKWRPDNTDADLLTDSLDEDISIRTSLGTRVQTWHYPSPNECLMCHTSAAHGVLGVKTRQSNRDFLYPNGVTDNQLRTWNHVGLFSTSLNESDISGYSRLTSVTNLSADLEWRARSYLDANCAQCHRPGGAPVVWDARFDTPLLSAGIVGATATLNLGITGAKIVAPGHPEKSVLLVRDSSLDPSIKMPPLAKNVVDTNAVTVVQAWINSLQPVPDTIPLPWLQEDIGAVGSAGDASYAGGVLTASASGDDIWNAADAFHYVYESVTGDFDVSVRVTRLDNSDAWAKAGIMIRESDSPGSRQAIVCVTPGNGTAFQRRLTTNGGSDHTAGPSATVPYWVRMARAGNVITGYVSPNGSAWTAIDSITLAVPSNALVGFALTAHNNSAVTTATFDRFKSNASFPPLNALPLVSLTAPTAGSILISPGNIMVTATASDPDGSVAKVEFFDGSVKIGETTNSPYSIVWLSPSLGGHTLSARALDNLAATANSTPVEVTVAGLAIGEPALAAIDGSVSFQFAGQSGSSYVIEVSTDLESWMPMATNAVVNGIARFVDLHPTDSQRFYRVRLGP